MLSRNKELVGFALALPRRAVIAALIATVAAPQLAAQVEDFDERVLAFNVAWNKFMRLHFGCPPEAQNIGQCEESKSVLAYAEFMKAAKEARKLFDLEKRN